MHELVEEKLGVAVSSFDSLDAFKEAAIAAGLPAGIASEVKSSGELVAKYFEEFCEAQLIQPTFVTDYPVEVSLIPFQTSLFFIR